jgi:hypothetical protein
VFEHEPGSYDICPVCWWEDDLVQLRRPDMAGGANGPSLIEAQRNFQRTGASDERLVEHVRPARASEAVDPRWRAFDPDLDRVEERSPGDDIGPTHRHDNYYWRRASR